MDITINNFAVKIPNDYNQVQSMPGDPVGSMSYMKKTVNAVCLVMYNSIPASQAMPFNSPQDVIDGIHGVLAQDQGVIEVETGITSNGRKYIYSIIKTINRDRNGTSSGNQYTLIMHISGFADSVFQAQGYFEETGYASNRSTSIYAILQSGGKIGSDGNGWAVDPYDPSYTRGALMNLGEKKDYDEAFPDHPLSQARKVAAELIYAN